MSGSPEKGQEDKPREYLKSKLQMQALITNLSTLIISKEVQNENKRGFGDAGRVTPKGPWLGCSGSSERYSLPGGQWRNTTLYSSSVNRHTCLEPARPLLGIYPKETIKREQKAIQGSVT